MKYKLLDVVVLDRDLPDHGLRKDDLGTGKTEVWLTPPTLATCGNTWSSANCTRNWDATPSAIGEPSTATNGPNFVVWFAFRVGSLS